MTLEASVTAPKRVTTDLAMSNNLTFATGRFPQRTRFVIVNNRMPRTGGHCAFCGGIIEKGYVRDTRTALTYCDTQCLPDENISDATCQKSREEGVMNAQILPAIAISATWSLIGAVGSLSGAIVQGIAVMPFWLSIVPSERNRNGATRPISSGFSNNRS